MAATPTQVRNFIASARVAVSDFVDKECRKERLGHKDMFCERQKVILVTAYLEIITKYFEPFLLKGVEDGSYADNNFFEIPEIEDCMQHLNNICDTFYSIVL